MTLLFLRIAKSFDKTFIEGIPNPLFLNLFKCAMNNNQMICQTVVFSKQHSEKQTGEVLNLILNLRFRLFLLQIQINNFTIFCVVTG